MSLTPGLRFSRGAQYVLLSNAAVSYPARLPYANLRRRLSSNTRPRAQRPRGSPKTVLRRASTTPETKPAHGPPAVSAPFDPKSPGSLSTPREPIPASSTLNPPATTRPPPLDLPARGPDASQFSYLFRIGKAYMQFYKAGVKAIFTNRRLLRSVAPPSGIASESAALPTRAEVLLRARTRHDISRLPVFGVLLLVCGEFTPLVVIAFPRLTPLTCRIPKQVEALRRSAAARREASFRQLAHLRAARGEKGAGPADGKLVAGHIARSLGLTSGWWDKAGLDSPFASSVADGAVAFLARDDALIRSGGGVGGIEDAEVVLACEDRGMDVREKEVGELRKRLEKWVRETEGSDEEASKDKVKRLLLTHELLM
ncbi:hypothetical protein DL768_007559 [Monosporascus sp. mg162]|nr:hypothetical protein DL768_007559 [Monosporascus sp. mg162]